MIQPQHSAGLVIAFARRGDVAKAPPCRDARFVRRHALVDQPLGLELDVRENFLRKVIVRTLTG